MFSDLLAGWLQVEHRRAQTREVGRTQRVAGVIVQILAVHPVDAVTQPTITYDTVTPISLHPNSADKRCIRSELRTELSLLTHLQP